MNIIAKALDLPDGYKRMKSERTLLLYGMGDGAEKIASVLADKGIKWHGVIASDGFVRGQEFLGKRVMPVSEAEAEFGDFSAVLCFGAEGERSDFLYSFAGHHRLYSPCVPVYGAGLADHEWLHSNTGKLERVYEMLEDDVSKKIFVSYLSYCITCDIGYLRETFDFTFPDGIFTHDDIHIDAGAYDGDTVREYIKKNNRYRHIYAFEPERKSYEKLCAAISSVRDTTALYLAVGAKNGKAAGMGSGRGSFLTEGMGTDIVSLDSFFGREILGRRTEKIGSIKLDCEGMDEEAIFGAVNIIYEDKPDMLISIYHRAYDFVDIPLLIKKHNPNYKFYLRRKKYIPPWDFCLLCKK